MQDHGAAGDLQLAPRIVRSPALALTPATFSVAEAAQGSPITLTASFHNGTAPAGTPVDFPSDGRESANGDG